MHAFNRVSSFNAAPDPGSAPASSRCKAEGSGMVGVDPRGGATLDVGRSLLDEPVPRAALAGVDVRSTEVLIFARAEALFTSELSAFSPATPAQVADAIRYAVADARDPRVRGGGGRCLRRAPGNRCAPNALGPQGGRIDLRQGRVSGRGPPMVSDFTVTGFDGTELASHVHPVLMTITTNPLGWGQAAAQTLFQAAGHASKESIAEVNLAPGLLEVRSSTARPPRQPGAPRPRRRRIDAARG
jgi:hypothetical protein